MHLTTTLLRDLVRLPSVNPMGRPLTDDLLYEHRVTAYLEQFFKDLGVPCERQTVAPQRDNIVARWQPAGAKRTLVFEAHQDTVPVDRMTIDPFCGTIENGKLYGRGACDIKGGMASMLGAFARLVREKPAGASGVIMACTVDEEHTFLGVQLLASLLRKQGEFPDGAIVAEPTELKIVNAHKGVVRWHLTTAGRSCHSSAPEQGVNAIYHMSRVLPLIEDFAEKLRQSRTDPVLGPPTLSVGRIDGGTSVNTVPDFCRIEIDRRLIPGEESLAAIRDFSGWMRNSIPAGITWTCSDPYLNAPALSAAGSESLVQRLGQSIDRVVGSHTVHAVPYGTDASTIALAGIPSVVFGPGNIAQAHTCDEWVSLEQVEQASEILYKLATCG